MLSSATDVQQADACPYHIIFDSDRDGSTELYGLDLGTLQVEKISDTKDPSISNRFPDWSPDGRRVVVVSEDRETHRGVLVVMRITDGRRHLIVSDTAVFENPAWSPNGEWIAFEMAVEDDWGLYLVRPDGSGLRRIGQPGVNLFHPSWSPDGSELAVVSGRPQAWVAAVVDLRTGFPRAIDTDSIQVASVKWSPDGQRLAFDGVINETNFDLYTMNIDGSDRRRLTNHPAVDARPEWSPDGRRIVFHSTRDYGSVGGSERWDEFELYTLEVATGSVRRLTRNRRFDAHPDWCQGRFSPPNQN
jgi:TolB protein